MCGCQGTVSGAARLYRPGVAPFSTSRKNENRKVKSRVGSPRAPLTAVVKQNMRVTLKPGRGACRTVRSLYIREVVSTSLRGWQPGTRRFLVFPSLPKRERERRGEAARERVSACSWEWSPTGFLPTVLGTLGVTEISG